MTWFPARWPAEDPDLIQLYTLPTPNGQKVSICLEEMGLPYETHRIDIGKGDQHDPDYLKLSPNGKIPTLLDPHGPEDEPIILMESIVILQYLADKTGQFFPRTYRARLEGQQWLAFQAAHIGPMFGQFGHFFKWAKGKTSDTYAETRYTNEVKRLLKVLNDRLTDRDYLIGEYSIVDMATVPWVYGLDDGYQAGAVLPLSDYPRVNDWVQRVTSRPAYRWGKDVGR
ncbi:MAG TPA: glutathione S-transferase N-terminal domain-containing protein [Candidatus Acidoferrum sp.]|nr:glutathione S-transferase N-terminal domain-containing protein [Candidatus Acidoferrum sp.]